jgi:hypothetical protein
VRIGALAAYADPHSWSALPPESVGGFDGHVSTGLEIEINPVGSLEGKLPFRVANRPMMSVPFSPSPDLTFLQTHKIKAIRESVFYRVILVIGMRSEIIGRLAPRSSLVRTDIIGKYRDHRLLSTERHFFAPIG